MAARQVFIGLLITTSTFLAAAGLFVYVKSTRVVFKDSMLEASVRELLEIPQGPILRTQASEITNLTLSGLNIRSLAGLEHFVNLLELDLSNNMISDITALAGLKHLKELDLSRNQIANIEPLRNLDTVEILSLEYNHISDGSVFSSMDRLGVLGIAHNTNFWGIPSGSNSLYALGLDGCGVRTLTDIVGLPNLAVLDVTANHLNSLEGIEAFPRLTIAYFNHNSITRFPEFVKTMNVALLSLKGNSIYRIDEFPHMPLLTRLDLSGNGINALPSIDPLPSLERLDLDDNPLSESICAGAEYYRQKGVSIYAAQCPEIPKPAPPNYSGEMPFWKRHRLATQEKNQNRSMTPGYQYAPNAQADIATSNPIWK